MPPLFVSEVLYILLSKKILNAIDVIHVRILNDEPKALSRASVFLQITIGMSEFSFLPVIILI